MGKPELEDYLDGLDWLVANKQGDRDRAGIYGGSYGGFMAFVALFKVSRACSRPAPRCARSATGRSTTTNTPATSSTRPELDPEAYRAPARSIADRVRAWMTCRTMLAQRLLIALTA
jgi:dipeptidyl aminopeptidase/acylaminoacyl peptidase